MLEEKLGRKQERRGKEKREKGRTRKIKEMEKIVKMNITTLVVLIVCNIFYSKILF